MSTILLCGGSTGKDMMVGEVKPYSGKPAMTLSHSDARGNNVWVDSGVVGVGRLL